MKKKYLLFILLLLVAYFLFYPTPIDPGVWTAPKAPEMKGAYAANTALRSTRKFTHPCPKCEDVAVDSLGRIYGGTEDGRILRFDNETAKPVVFALTKGRPLGLFINKQQQLIVADADYGLYQFSPEGVGILLTDEYGNRSFGFTNDLEITADNTIYFTDASWKFPVATYKLDLLEHQPNGALYSYNPNSRRKVQLKDQLYFPNGVALSAEEDFLLICETGKFWVKKVWLKGSKRGTVETIIENLPGFPDGISSGTDDVFWIALVSPRNKLLDALMDKPFLRKMILRLPDALQPAPEKYATVIGIDGNGKVVYNLQDPEGHFSQISNVREANGKLYFGTLGGETIGVMDRPR